MRKQHSPWKREGECTYNENLVKRKAFTLAEVLITLAIISIVAVLTMANLIKSYQKYVTVSKLKTAYGTVSKIIQTAESKQGSVASWYTSQDVIHNTTSERYRPVLDNFANIYLIPYVNATDSGRKPLKDFGYKNGIFYPNGTTMYSADTLVMGMQSANGMFIFVGVNYHFKKGDENNPERRYGTRIALDVDLDGPKHGANAFGKDIFVFSKYLSSDLKLSQLYPEGYVDATYTPSTKTFSNMYFETRERLLDGCKNGAANWCAALIMKDGWKISDDYPWL